MLAVDAFGEYIYRHSIYIVTLQSLVTYRASMTAKYSLEASVLHLLTLVIIIIIIFVVVVVVVVDY